MVEKAPLKHSDGVSQIIEIQELSQNDWALSSNISGELSMSTAVKFLRSKYDIQNIIHHSQNDLIHNKLRIQGETPFWLFVIASSLSEVR